MNTKQWTRIWFECYDRAYQIHLENLQLRIEHYQDGQSRVNQIDTDDVLATTQKLFEKASLTT